MNGHPENLLLSYEPRYCPPSQLVAAMRRATSHTQLRLLLAGVAVACLALPALRVPAQPQRAVPPQRPLPPSRDGSHDFDFLEGTWQISDAPADYFTRGPFGRMVARIPAPRTATLEWYTREPDTVADSGFVRTAQLTVDEACHPLHIVDDANEAGHIHTVDCVRCAMIVPVFASGEMQRGDSVR